MTYKFENITVLIVDSQPAIVDLIKSVLKMFGVKDVLTSTDAETGLKTFKGRKPDLLIVDWDLDDINGLAFIKAIRHDPVNPHVPIIFTTALSSAKRVAQARDSGITEFLRKPFTAEALFKRIEAIVEKHFKGEEKRGKWFIDDEN
jgi:two-component system chemotaxis response regulator CheY